ncbi:hypothetical protein CLOLEP_02836 [[Clostridium] leptum DSM 753]|uniref:Uncharacterized protein n=1 Tax=[Clostridium] leptum DSM 753 TaxID=428125 RepID=A7VW72_9FIRM|nr:hypothetical protein CLOLEP_02836 [[Clostridium] leptum DSM 753]
MLRPRFYEIEKVYRLSFPAFLFFINEKELCWKMAETSRRISSKIKII